MQTIDWPKVAGELDATGCATFPLLTPHECSEIAALYARPDVFRSRVIMAQHGFGRGEYQYFSAPLPDRIATLRTELYALLADIANNWAVRLKQPTRYPPDHGGFLAKCHKAGQTKPTPLLLRYGPGDYNCLHRDLYGPLAFPFQVAILLSVPHQDFTGGEFVLVEQRPRAQSRALVVPLHQGEAVVFPVSERPAAGTRGDYRVMMRHGVSQVRSGTRFTLGIIFHDAR